MKIEELKKQADEEVIRQDKIKSMQANAISEFENFFKVMEQSYSLWNEKMKNTVDQFISDIMKYFEQNGFSVQSDNENDFFDSATQIKATYKELTFILSGINYDRDKMYFTNGQGISEEIWIALPINLPDYYVWKDNIDIGGKGLHDFGSTVTDAYKKFVYQFNTEEELNLLMKKIDINISHFQKAIETIDDIELCIHRFGTDVTYNNFNDFISAVE